MKGIPVSLNIFELNFASDVYKGYTSYIGVITFCTRMCGVLACMTLDNNMTNKVESDLSPNVCYLSFIDFRLDNQARTNFLSIENFHTLVCCHYHFVSL